MGLGSLFKKVLPIGGAAAGFALGGPTGALMGASLGASAGGRTKGGKQASYQGYAALPEGGKNAYNRYFDYVNNVDPDFYPPNRFEQVNEPMSPFDSNELYKLQQIYGDQGVKPIGIVEGFNEYQRNALSQLGAPDYSTSGLSAYMQPFEGMRNRTLANIDRRADERLAKVRGREARVGSLARDANYGGQLPQVEEARTRAMLDAEAAYTDRALDLRQKSLTGQLNAGNTIQNQNQVMLDASRPEKAFTYSPQFGRALAYQQLLAGMPNSGQQISTPQKLNTLGRLGNVGVSLFGNKLQDLLMGL